ncbi:mechanosensitive ion channel domain-containing protein [Lacinutrix sp. MedPE-SW]|uniref:mechanosensitive ion channel family protein n=1 Tax=Lacinutrix sp. MedPE-SW TaxID=1860087 RepID=UPI00092439F4|nr:mechanosensitive ion channel domain-containing protein [Lacinutrix sp. MedPE-SW]OIQ23817.1 MAG: mechanosensitive ion channel protein MscS [Lacinutrix sp. MedPE-SW]
MQEQIACFFYDYYEVFGFNETAAKYLNMFTLLIIALCIIYFVDKIITKTLRVASVRIAEHTKSPFDDLLLANKVPRNVAHIFPLILALNLLPIIFADFDYIESPVRKLLQVTFIILVLWIVRSVLHTIEDFLKTIPSLRDKPIDSYIQVFMIFAWIVGAFAAIAVFTNLSIIKFITGFGAASAIILLIFKDTILGFVASIQVSINDMVRIGDWITFEKYGADGDVVEINLATVKVQNFDNTITTIPTYAMISDSFKNWRGMKNSDGRRIKRHLMIKQDSIKYLTPEDVERLKDVQLISSYLAGMQEKLDKYNTENNVDKTLLLNGRNLTNIGVFRKYIQTYLENHSAINKDMLLMARQLQPTTQGVPLEVYAFSKDKRWENYEYVMSDLFDHFLAAVPFFELEIFELPSSKTFKA